MMQIIRPNTLGPDQLVSCNVPEDDAPVWDTNTNYSLGQQCMVDHRIYEALTSTQGDYPPDNPDKWQDIGATNRWRLLDEKVSTATVSDAAFIHGAGNGIQIELAPARVTNSIALFGVYGSQITVEVIDPVEGEVYQQASALVDNSGIDNVYAYCFQPIERQETIIFLDLPNYGTANVRISISSGVGEARCGQLVMGMKHTLGSLEFGYGLRMMDFSERDRDEFGNLEIQERDWSRSGSFDVAMPVNRIDYNYRMLAKYRQTPLVWIGGHAIIFGVFDDWDIVHTDQKYADLALRVEGLI